MFLFSIFMIQLGYCQKEWAPIGAKWFMNSSVSLGGTTPSEPHLKNYYTIESLKDTVINSISFRLVGDYPMLQDGGNIYYYHNDTLRLIYAFEVSKNDTVTFNMLSCFGSIIDMEYKVAKIDSIIVDNDTLRRVKCELLSGRDLNPNPYEYIEKIGSKRILIEDAAGCSSIPESRPPWLRCYQEGDLLYKTEAFLNYGNYDCDYVEPVSTIPTRKYSDINIYPNPAADCINISFDNNKHSDFFLSIYDVQGKLQKSKKLDLNNSNISISDLVTGIYILKITDNEKVLKMDKLIIE